MRRVEREEVFQWLAYQHVRRGQPSVSVQVVPVSQPCPCNGDFIHFPFAASDFTPSSALVFACAKPTDVSL